MAAGAAGVTRWLLRCGLLAGPAFLGIAAVDGWLRPGYRAGRHPISALALGGHGGVQVTNFFAAGTLCAGFAAGLARASPADLPRPVPGLVALTAAALMACGVFPADPVNGYPPGTPLAPEMMTGPGIAHLAASAVVMVSVPGTMALAARAARRGGDRAWAARSAAAAAVVAGAFAGASAGFAQLRGLPATAGALQRVAVAVGFCWLGALARRALRGWRPAGRTPAAPVPAG